MNDSIYAPDRLGAYVGVHYPADALTWAQEMFLEGSPTRHFVRAYFLEHPDRLKTDGYSHTSLDGVVFSRTLATSYFGQSSPGSTPVDPSEIPNLAQVTFEPPIAREEEAARDLIAHTGAVLHMTGLRSSTSQGGAHTYPQGDLLDRFLRWLGL